MSQKTGFVLLQLVRWLPVVLLTFNIVEPSIRGSVLGVIENSGDALADHADRLVRELDSFLSVDARLVQCEGERGQRHPGDEQSPAVERGHHVPARRRSAVRPAPWTT